MELLMMKYRTTGRLGLLAQHLDLSPAHPFNETAYSSDF